MRRARSHEKFQIATGGESGGAASRRCVLVVDDHHDSADSLSWVLALFGYRVATAYDGPSALEAAIEVRPDVAVLDIGLPGMDGYKLARRLRSQPGGEDIVLIALTGWGGEEFRRMARGVGFDHFFVKPVTMDSLVAVIGSVVDQAGQEGPSTASASPPIPAATVR